MARASILPRRLTTLRAWVPYRLLRSDQQAGGSPQSAPIENGDLLPAGEFLRRYEAMPHVKRTELIEGVVYH